MKFSHLQNSAERHSAYHMNTDFNDSYQQTLRTFIDTSFKNTAQKICAVFSIIYL